MAKLEAGKRIGFGILFLLALVVLPIILLESAKPDAGFEAVLIHKPLLFGHGGVDPEPVSTGRTYAWWTTDIVNVNMQPQQFQLHFEDLMSSDAVPLDFDSIIRLQVTDSVKLVKSFGPKWYENNIEKEFSNRVRQAVRKHGMNETAINTSAIQAIDDEVSGEMEKYLKSAGLPVRLMQVTVGRANPPDAIKHQRVETAAQQQRVITEQERKKAEDARKEAEISRAIADNAYRNSIGLSTEQFILLKSIEMQRSVCTGTNCTFIIGQQGVLPTIKVGK